ncbi:MAG: hypothetical protein SGI73_10990 [Chloroflexota bacterium]|nr:hypothetical protein [Chloroflexota bacterium]
MNGCPNCKSVRYNVAFAHSTGAEQIDHAGLHWALRKHPQYEFKTWFSNVWIFGVVPLAALYLALIVR